MEEKNKSEVNALLFTMHVISKYEFSILRAEYGLSHLLVYGRENISIHYENVTQENIFPREKETVLNRKNSPIFLALVFLRPC